MFRNKLIALGLCLFLAIADPAISQESAEEALELRQGALQQQVSASSPLISGEPANFVKGQDASTPVATSRGVGYYSVAGGKRVHRFVIVDHTADFWPAYEARKLGLDRDEGPASSALAIPASALKHAPDR